jgi:hypothetical protein
MFNYCYVFDFNINNVIVRIEINKHYKERIFDKSFKLFMLQKLLKMDFGSRILNFDSLFIQNE